MSQMLREEIVLSSTDVFLTQDPEETYQLKKGSILVFVVPMEAGRPGKPEFYCEIKDTDRMKTVPGMAYTDPSHRQWRIMLKAAEEEARIAKYPASATDVLRKSFLKRRNIDTIAQEGFENSLVQFYTKHILVKDHAFIRKSENAEVESGKKLVDYVSDVFSENGQIEHTGNDYYQALQFLCKKMDIELIKPDELVLRCGKEPSLTDIAKMSDFICRKVVLDAEWYHFDCGGFVGTLDKEVIACIPNKKGKYLLYRSSDEKVMQLTPKMAKQISPEAYSIGRTLPSRSLTQRDVVHFCRKSIKRQDFVPYLILTALTTLIGVLLPTLNQMIYDDYIPIGNIGNLVQLSVVLLSFMIGNIAFSIVENLFGYRVTSRVGNDLQNAVYHRLFHLPESFFRKYDSADLAGRVSTIGTVASAYANTLVLSSISGVFAVFYLIRMVTYSAKLTWVSAAVYLAYILLITAITATARKGRMRAAEAESEYSGKLYQYLNGVDKIRMAGVEDRALLSFMKPYTRRQFEEISINRLVSLEEALTSVSKSIFSMVLYWVAVKKLDAGTLSVGVFVAFNTAFGSFTGALDSLVDQGLQIFQERREIKRFWPVFETKPEDDISKEVPGPLSGGVSLEHVTFAYSSGEKNVLNDLSLVIRPGEYVGIVGPSGCGKSTLLKLLLGFENPQRGMVTLDRKDLKTINKSAYRRQLGVVLQNGKLISGSIYDNITIAAPNATMARVNEVVEKVGLKDDIAQMPMGLHTMLSENCNTISGGQQQRVLIARAICGDPKILIFDEATSALDNMTQAAVSSALDQMHVTRIVVAHRLSTIKNCDRILVLNEGTIVQEGTYETLMQDQTGLFYALASRQIAQ